MKYKFTLNTSIVIRNMSVRGHFLGRPSFGVSVARRTYDALVRASPSAGGVIFFPGRLLRRVERYIKRSLRGRIRVRKFCPVVNGGKDGDVQLLRNTRRRDAIVRGVGSGSGRGLRSFIGGRRLAIS